MTYPAASIYFDLPLSAASLVDLVVDNRLATSSRRSISSALQHWEAVRLRHGWDAVIASGDPARGTKMVCFVVYMIYETGLSLLSLIHI